MVASEQLDADRLGEELGLVQGRVRRAVRERDPVHAEGVISLKKTAKRRWFVDVDEQRGGRGEGRGGTTVSTEAQLRYKKLGKSRASPQLSASEHDLF